MGGIGSGRRYHWDAKSTVEGCRCLTASRLNRAGMLTPGWHGWGWWNQDGEQTASIGIRVLDKYELQLSYAIGSDGDRENLQYTVHLDWFTCNYGGKRPYFVCPNTRCGERVHKLYLRGKYFACRKCHDLAYTSQHEAPAFRLLSKAQGIRKKLGSDSLSTLDPFPGKPRYMHWETYSRLCRQYEDARYISIMQMARSLGHPL